MNFMARSKKCDRAGAQEKSWHASNRRGSTWLQAKLGQMKSSGAGIIFSLPNT
jgi:hypothetical protein